MKAASQPIDYRLLRPGSDDLPKNETAWDVLDCFLRDLHNLDQTVTQIRATLKAVRDSLRADVVFWYPGSRAETVEIVGDRALTPDWCHDFVQSVLEGTTGDESHLLRANLSAAAAFLPTANSAALVRVSKSKSIWMVALSFNAERRFHLTDVKIMTLARRMLLNQRQQGQAFGKLKETLFGLVHCLTTAIEAKDTYTCGHSERVGRIAVRLGQKMDLPHRMVSDIYLAGLLHDIGKIGIRDSVLQKPGQLTTEDFEHVKEHVTIGDRIMAQVPQLHHLRSGVRNHHERFDGKGYPDGLAGNDIPLLARVLAVADSCDAMMSARPYRSSLPTRQIDALMADGAGTQWDPEIIDVFLSCRYDLYSICQQGIGESLIVAVEHAVETANSIAARELS